MIDFNFAAYSDISVLIIKELIRQRTYAEYSWRKGIIVTVGVATVRFVAIFKTLKKIFQLVEKSLPY